MKIIKTVLILSCFYSLPFFASGQYRPEGYEDSSLSYYKVYYAKSGHWLQTMGGLPITYDYMLSRLSIYDESRYQVSVSKVWKRNQRYMADILLPFCVLGMYYNHTNPSFVGPLQRFAGIGLLSSLTGMLTAGAISRLHIKMAVKDYNLRRRV